MECRACKKSIESISNHGSDSHPLCYSCASLLHCSQCNVKLNVTEIRFESKSPLCVKCYDAKQNELRVLAADELDSQGGDGVDDFFGYILSIAIISLPILLAITLGIILNSLFGNYWLLVYGIVIVAVVAFVWLLGKGNSGKPLTAHKIVLDCDKIVFTEFGDIDGPYEHERTYSTEDILYVGITEPWEFQIWFKKGNCEMGEKVEFRHIPEQDRAGLLKKLQELKAKYSKNL